MAGVRDEPLLILGVADLGTDRSVRENPYDKIAERRTDKAEQKHNRAYPSLVGDLVGDVEKHDDGLTVVLVNLVAVVAHPAVLVAFLDGFLGVGEGAVFVDLVDVSGDGIAVALVLVDYGEVAHSENRLGAFVDFCIESLAEDFSENSGKVLGGRAYAVVGRAVPVARRGVKVDLAAVLDKVVKSVVHLTYGGYVVDIEYRAAHDQHDREQRDKRERNEFAPQLFY